MSSDNSPSPNHIWLHPLTEEGEPSLIHLTPQRLSLAVVPEEDLEKTAEALRGGAEIVAKQIPLSLITRLEGEAQDAELIVTYQQGESKPETVTITLADEASRDQLLDALVLQLGPGWRRNEKAWHRLRAGVWPFVGFLVVTAVTWFMHFEAQQIAVGEHLTATGRSKIRLIRGAMIWIEGLIGTTGVLIAGGVLAGLCLLWLLTTLLNPPIHITVQREAAD